MSDRDPVEMVEVVDGVAVREVSVPLTEKMDVLTALAATADKRVAALKKIRMACVKMTNYHDWVDQDGRPYLQSSGAEKIADLVGVSWKIIKTDRVQKDGEYIWVFTIRITTPWGREIEVEGTRSSKDPLFSRAHGHDIPMEQVDEADVRKSALTNTFGRGIAIVLGLRNMSYEELAEYGITADKIGKVDRFQGKVSPTEATPEAKKAADDLRNEVRELLTEMCGGDATKALKKLTEVTSFTGKDGTQVEGVKSFSYLKDKRLDVTLGKVRELHKSWQADMKAASEEGRA